MSKGSTQRPRQVEQPVYEENWNHTFGSGVFHRYQLTSEVVEVDGEYARLVLDRQTGGAAPWIDEPKNTPKDAPKDEPKEGQDDGA